MVFADVFLQEAAADRHRGVSPPTRLDGAFRLPEPLHETHRGRQRKTHQKVSTPALTEYTCTH